MSADTAATARLRSVRVTVEGLDGSGRSESTFGLVPGSAATTVALPLSFAVTPLGGDAARRVRVTAQGVGDNGCALVQRSAALGFLSRRIVVLPLALQSACAGRSCGPGTTCVAGPDPRCVPDAVDANTLPQRASLAAGEEAQLASAEVRYEGDATTPVAACGAESPDGASSDAAETGVDSSPEASLEAGPDALDAAMDATDARPDGPPADAVTSGPAPQPLAPLSTATVTSRLPTLRWALPAAADGVMLELCRDRACTTSERSLRAMGTAVTLGMPALGTGWHYWRLRATSGVDVSMVYSPTWQFYVPARSSPRADGSSGTWLDYNGDGFADVAVGAPRAPEGGHVLLYPGATAGLPTSPPVTLAPRTGMVDLFGAAVASAGDVNGDGFADLLVGSWGRGSGIGSAYLYLGGASGLPIDANQRLDGAEAGGQFGRAVTALGDIDGDGYGDVAVGAPAVLGNEGRVYVYRGSAMGLVATPLEVPSPVAGSGFFGSAVAGAGDVNGDGYGDLLVGARTQASQDGRAYLYLGGRTIDWSAPSLTVPGPDPSGQFGYAVAGLGDVNADGFADVAVGAPYANSSAGRVLVYLGSATGLDTATPAASFAGSSSSYRLGWSLSGAGDVNADGYADLVAGAPGAVTSYGQVQLFRGSGSAPYLTAVTPVVRGPAMDQRFAEAVAGVGDIDGDGYFDAAVGASYTAANNGAAYLLRGSAAGLSTALVTLASPDTGGYFGEALAWYAPRRRWRRL